MTNSFFVAVMVLWHTNRMDTIVTPSGDEIVRSIITSQTHVYTVPGHPTVTNRVSVSTNAAHLRQVWLVVATNVTHIPTNGVILDHSKWVIPNLPPVPDYK